MSAAAFPNERDSKAEVNHEPRQDASTGEPTGGGTKSPDEIQTKRGSRLN